LSWPDIDFDGSIIRVRRASQYIPGQGIIEVATKNRSSERSISIAPFVIELLKEYKKWWEEYRSNLGDLWQGEKERLFIQYDGKPLFPDTVNRWLRSFVERNGLPKITPHSLRHTFASLQIAAGVDVRTVQSITGHSQASTLLNIYSHAIESAQLKAAQTIADTLLGAKKASKTAAKDES
jgi:integrase